MASSTPTPAGDMQAPSRLLWSALDRLEEGVAVFDSDRRLVYSNAPFRQLRSYPESVCRIGAHIISAWSGQYRGSHLELGRANSPR